MAENSQLYVILPGQTHSALLPKDKRRNPLVVPNVRLQEVVTINGKSRPVGDTSRIGTGYVVVTKDGEDYSFERTYRTPTPAAGLYEPQMIDVPVIPPPYDKLAVGCYPVVALPESGKTRFFNAFAAVSNEPVITFGFGEAPEPSRNPDSVATSWAEILNGIAAQYAKGHRIFVADSFQTAVFSTGGGAAMAGGISPGLWELVTQWSWACSEAGILMFVSMNPLSDDPEKINPFVIAAKGSSTGTIWMERPLEYRITARFPLSARRKTRMFQNDGTDSFEAIEGEIDDVLDSKNVRVAPRTYRDAIPSSQPSQADIDLMLADDMGL